MGAFLENRCLSDWCSHKRIISNTRNAIADHDVGQASASSERCVSDAGDAIGDCDAGQAGAFRECVVSDVGGGVGIVKVPALPPGHLIDVV